MTKFSAVRLLLAVLFLAFPLHGAKAEKVWRVGIHEKPPYAMKDEEGQWEGLAVDLWEGIANKLQWKFEYVPVLYEDLIPSLETGKVDILIGELAVEANLEEKIDFSQPFMTSSLGIVESSTRWKTNWLEIVRGMLNWSLAQILIIIGVGIIMVSLLIWLVERRHSSNHFGGDRLSGLGSAVWFSAVTMTTVGYGDKTPQTMLGRVVAFLWMMAGVLIIAGFTASVASSVAAAHMKQGIIDPFDLARMRNGVLKGGDAERLLGRYGIRTVSFESPYKAMDAVRRGSIQTLVGDRVMLAYLIQHGNADKMVLLPLRFHDFHVSFALPDNAPEMDALNVALLEITSSDAWRARLRFWLGADNYPSF